MEEETKTYLTYLGVAAVAYLGYGIYQYWAWKDEAVKAAVTQGRTGATNITQADFEKYLAGTKMVDAYTGTVVAPTGIIASIYMPLKALFVPITGAIAPFAAA